MQEFHPEPGDTIVCNNGAEYVCVTAQEYKNEYGTDGEHAIYAFAGFSSHMRWARHDGKSLYNSGYDIAEIIKQANTKVFKANTSVFKANKANKADDNNLEYQLKVLEKENAMLRSLLRKHGAFI